MGLFSTVGSKKISAVPVLAEPKLAPIVEETEIRGKARESTNTASGLTEEPRGGRKPSEETPQAKWRKKNKVHLAEYQRLYRAAKKVKEK